MAYRRLQVCEPLSQGASSGEEDSDGAGGGFGASTSSSDLSGEDSDMSGEDEQLCCQERESHIFRRLSDRHLGGIPASKLAKALRKLGLKTDTPEMKARADRDCNSVIDREEFQDCINHVYVEEAKAKAAKAKAQIETVRKEILEGKDGDGLRQAADQLHECWRDITMHKFLRWFQAMEQDPCAQEDRVEMLNSLMLTVPENYFKTSWRGKQAADQTGIMEHTSFGKLHGDIMKGDSVVVEFSSQKLPVGPAANDDEKLAVDFQRRWSGVDIENSLLGNVKEKYLLAYFTLPLLRKEHIHDVVREIERASVDSKIFATPLVSAILTEGWHTIQPVFYGVLVLDFSVIVCLSISATDARNQKIPSRCCILVLFFISSVFFVNEVSIAIRRISSRRQSKPFFDSFWSFYEMMVTLYFFAIMVAGLYCKRDLVRSARALTPKQESWLYNHAIWVEFLVFLKTTHFSIKLLCVRALGERVIPAYCALTHKSSLGLLVFLFVLYCNACLTFHAVPVNIYAPDEADRQPWDYWENWFDLFILQFRLAFLGESEPDELEGSNKRVLFNITGNKWEGDILDPSTHTRYHHGVQVTNVLFLIFIHILVLNVYIGVLSQQYNNFVRREREHFEKFRAFFIGKQIYWSRHCPRCRRRSEGADATWIAYKRSVFRDPFDEDGKMQQERAQELQKFSDRLELAAEDRAELMRILQATAPPKAK